MNNKWKKSIFAITLTTAIVIIIVLLLKCCSGDKQKELINISDTLGIKKDSSAISNRLSCIDSIPLQQFIIEGGRHQIITGQKGSSFLFPANCFVDENDIQVSGKITIELREVNTIKDFIKGGITTLSDGRVLASDGCYYLNAKQNGKNLKLKDMYSVYASLPRTKNSEGMQFFKGDRKSTLNINWKLDEYKKELNTNDIPKLPEQEQVKLNFEENKKITSLLAKRNQIAQIIANMQIHIGRLKNYLADNINNKDVKYIKQSIEVEDGVRKDYYMPETYVSNKELLQKHRYTCFNDELYRIRTKNNIIDTLYYLINEAYFISIKGDRKKEFEKKDFRYYMADTVNSRLKMLTEYTKIIEEKTQELNEIKEKLKEFGANWELAWQMFIGQPQGQGEFSMLTKEEAAEAKKKELKKKGIEAPYLYSLERDYFGEVYPANGWFNIDKLYAKGYDIIDFSGETNPRSEIHLVSKEEMVHLISPPEGSYSNDGSHAIVKNGNNFSFKFPKGRPFQLIFLEQGKKEIVKDYDGTNQNLGKM